MTFDKVLIIGLGQLGLPAARYIKEIGFDTYGYDINPKAMKIAEKTVGIKQATDFGINNFDVYVINVSTHKPDDRSSPQIDGLLSIAHKISREAKKDGALVSIESTIPKGTSKKVFEIFNHRLHVVHALHRWYALEEKEHGVNRLRVIGGVCDCCLRIGLQFYCENDDGVEGRIYPTTRSKNLVKSKGNEFASLSRKQSEVAHKLTKNLTYVNNLPKSKLDGKISMFVGMDLHKNYLQIAVMKEKGKVLENSRISNKVSRFFDKNIDDEKVRVVMESSSVWYNISSSSANYL